MLLVYTAALTAFCNCSVEQRAANQIKLLNCIARVRMEIAEALLQIWEHLSPLAQLLPHPFDMRGV